MTTPSLDAYLKSAEDFAPLAAHAERLVSLQRIYAQIAPPALLQSSQVANYKAGIVIIHAANGAVAAKLRQLAPSLCGEFSKSGVEVTQIGVKVQPPPTLQPDPAPPCERTVSDHSRETLMRQAETLPADSQLRAALERLAQRNR